MTGEKFNVLVAEKKFPDASGRLVSREITSLSLGESTDFMGLNIQFAEKPPLGMGGKDDEGEAIVLRLTDNDPSRPVPNATLHIQRQNEEEQIVSAQEIFKKEPTAENIFVVAGLNNVVFFQIALPDPKGGETPSVVMDLSLQSQVGEGSSQMLH